MNDTKVNGIEELRVLIRELSDYKRPVSYNLSEIMVVPITGTSVFWVTWRKDGSR